MILTNQLRGIIVSKGLSQGKVAQHIGIAPKTFYEKMKIGVFSSTEIESMIELLEIEQPMNIFFAKNVSYKETKVEDLFKEKCSPVEEVK